MDGVRALREGYQNWRRPRSHPISGCVKCTTFDWHGSCDRHESVKQQRLAKQKRGVRRAYCFRSTVWHIADRKLEKHTGTHSLENDWSSTEGYFLFSCAWAPPLRSRGPRSSLGSHPSPGFPLDEPPAAPSGLWTSPQGRACPASTAPVVYGTQTREVHREWATWPEPGGSLLIQPATRRGRRENS